MPRTRNLRLLGFLAALGVIGGGSLALVAGAGGSTSSTRPVPVTELAVYDAHGKLVGSVVDISSTSHVVVVTRTPRETWAMPTISSRS